jgi:hypothetical protein
MPARCRNLPRHRTRIRAGALNAESVGDAPFGGGGLAVDAVSVDLEQDGAPVGKVLDFAWARFTSADVTS